MDKPHLLIEGLQFAEGPRWHAASQKLYFSDMHGLTVFTLDLQGTLAPVVRVPGHPSGLGFAPDGSLLIVSMRDHALLRLRGETTERVADMSAFVGGHSNDMVVDARGRAYVGNFGFDWDARADVKPTCIVLVTPDGRVRQVADGLLFPNGAVITPDGRTLIVAETFGGRLTAFTIAADGSLSDRRIFAEGPMVPDGICLDAEGCVWVANPVPKGGFARLGEGTVLKQHLVDADNDEWLAVACMLGGPDRRTLFMLESRSTHPPDAVPGNTRIRIVRVDVPGAGWP